MEKFLEESSYPFEGILRRFTMHVHKRFRGRILGIKSGEILPQVLSSASSRNNLLGFFQELPLGIPRLSLRDFSRRSPESFGEILIRNFWCISQSFLQEQSPEENPNGIIKWISWRFLEEHLRNLLEKLREDFSKGKLVKHCKGNQSRRNFWGTILRRYSRRHPWRELLEKITEETATVIARINFWRNL